MEILKLNEINKFYGENHALKDISFSVNKDTKLQPHKIQFYMLMQS